MMVALLWLVAAASTARAEPERLNRRLVASSLATLRREVRACGRGGMDPHKSILLTVTIAPEGTVTSVDAYSDDPFAPTDCLKSVHEKATFPKTRQGGTMIRMYWFCHGHGGCKARGEVPSALRSDNVEAGMTLVHDAIEGCLAKGQTRPQLLLDITRDGIVRKAEVIEGGNAATDACVLAAVSKATFPITDVGGHFVVPVLTDAYHVPSKLYKDDFEALSEPLRARVVACGVAASKGPLKLRVTVGRDGEVRTVAALTRAASDSCVLDAVKNASFPRTVAGGTFTYTFQR